MEFSLALKKDEILLFAGKWMELENIILSQISQRSHVFSHMWIIGPRQTEAAYKYIQNMYSKVELVEEIKGRGKEGKKDSK
jgi:hypothetical protein